MSEPSTSPTKSAPKLLDRVRQTMRINCYSPRTEAAYVDWIKRYIRFDGIRHTEEMEFTTEDTGNTEESKEQTLNAQRPTPGFERHPLRTADATESLEQDLQN